jgi:hypothetical protein
MSTALSLSSRLTLNAKQSGDSFTQAPVVVSNFALTNGVGVGQGNALWHEEVTVVNGSSQTINLTSLPVSAFNISGNLNFWLVRSFYIHNTSTTASVVVFDSDAENDPWDALYAVPIMLGPGGTLLAMDRVGWVVSSTSKTIKLVNEVEAEEFVGDTVADSRVISGIADTFPLEVGMIVVGTGVPAGAKIISKTASSVTLSAAATAAGADTTFDAAHPDPVLVFSLAGVLD